MNTWDRNRRTTRMLGAAVAALALSGCSLMPAPDAEPDAAPIVLGSINTISGPEAFPESSAAARAVFDRVNAEGGIRGHRIEYQVRDDEADVATAVGAARDLVEDGGVVALVGGASLLDCEVNGHYLVEHDVRSIPGVGVDAGCFSSSNIAPVNIGPFADTTATLYYGSEVLGLDRICVLTSVIGGTGPAYDAATERWTELTGVEPTYVDDTLPSGAGDYLPYIVRAREHGCDAVATNTVEPDAIAQLYAAAQIGWDDVTFLMLTSTYSESFARAAGNQEIDVYVPAEFSPFTEESDTNADWKQLMDANDITLSSFSQGGYLAASILVEVLRGIDGEITRESVNEALRTMAPVNNPMIAYPYEFERIAEQDYTPGAWPIVLEAGATTWRKAADDWLLLN